VARANELGVGASLAFLTNVDEINMRRRGRVKEILEEELGDLTGKTIAVWGLAFKPDSDDIRDSPALDIAQSLVTAGALVVATDPEALKPAGRRVDAAGMSDRLTLVHNHRDAVHGVDAIVVATEWNQYREDNPSDIALLVANPLVIDGRNCLSPDDWKAAGFRYRGMGRT
jgi:UDPglucose 6-dehydrogenase